jgi:hypothetical protein
VLAEQGERFPPLYIGIVKAAEGTSDLPRSLARYIDYQQRIDGVRARLVSAAIYPSILLLVGGAVSGFLITYVVPRFAEVFQGAGRNLPFMSRMLLGWGQFAASHSALLLAAIGVLAALLVLALRRLRARASLAGLLARLPGLRERVRIYELSRLYLTLGMLTECGIPLLQAIDTLQGMVSPALRGGLQQARLAIESGLPLSSAFAANGLTTPISLRMLRVGERAANGAVQPSRPPFTTARSMLDRHFAPEPLLMAAIIGGGRHRGAAVCRFSTSPRHVVSALPSPPARAGAARPGRAGARASAAPAAGKVDGSGRHRADPRLIVRAGRAVRRRSPKRPTASRSRRRSTCCRCRRRWRRCERCAARRRLVGVLADPFDSTC